MIENDQIHETQMALFVGCRNFVGTQLHSLAKCMCTQRMTDDRKQVSIQEIAVSNMISIEAMIRVLVRKGLITQQEILEEIKQVKS